MCDFFSCLVTRAGDVLFTETDSHDVAIERSGLIDDLEHFVRLEYAPSRGYIIDENSIPEWYERLACKARRNVKAAYRRIAGDHKIMIQSRLKAYNEYKTFCTGSLCANLAWDFEAWKICCDERWSEFWEMRQHVINEYKDKIENVKGYTPPFP